MGSTELKPIKESTEDFEAIEAAIVKLLREEIYIPLVKEIGLARKTLRNSTDDLLEAIRSGKIYFDRGYFRGRFRANVSRELKRIGAEWDRRKDAFRIPLGDLSIEIRTAIITAEHNVQKAYAKADEALEKILPEKIAERLKVEKFFDSTLFRLDRDIKASIKGITVTPELTAEQRRKIADGYTKDLQKYIKDWTAEEIGQLRRKIQKSTTGGFRYETLVKHIQESYGVGKNKARFLARQETALMMTKFKETRYLDAGVEEYIWQCSAGSKAHPVRPWHKSLEGKTFRWDDPPITSKPGEPVRRNNPGQDFNCRCYARPVVKF